MYPDVLVMVYSSGLIFISSFFPKEFRNLNEFPTSLVCSAEDAEDRVSSFTTLVRSRD